MLEKDGVSYNELSGLMDEIIQMSIKKNPDFEKINAYNQRIEKITNGLLVDKYNLANYKEKMEIGKRVRYIVGQQGINGKFKALEENLRIINNNTITEYCKNLKFIRGNLSELESQVLVNTVNNVLTERWDIPLEDIENIQLDKVVNQQNEVIGYIAKTEDKLINMVHVSEKPIDGARRVYDKFILNENATSLSEIGGTKAYIGMKQRVQKHNDKISYVKSPSAIFSIPEEHNYTLVLNTTKGVVAYKYNEQEDKLLGNYTVEKGLNMSDYLVEKDKSKPNLFKRISNRFNNKVKMLPEARENKKAPEEVAFSVFDNGKFVKKYKVDNQQLKNEPYQQKKNYDSKDYER